MTEARSRIVLDLEPGDPISGRITDQRGVTEPFFGWLDLTSKLERLRQDQTPPGVNLPVEADP